MKTAHAFVAYFALVSIGCSIFSPKDSAPGASAASSAAPSSAADTAGRNIEGVGFVPAWSMGEGPTSKCAAREPARLKMLDEGKDDALSAGTADTKQLVAEIAGDCASASGQLATAINGGGHANYRRGKYAEANRWWRAALTIEPSHVLARYNLACGLVIVGKNDDGVWQLGELGRAAHAGAPGALARLVRAKQDPDLRAVRDTQAFKDAVGEPEGEAPIMAAAVAAPIAPVANPGSGPFSPTASNELGRLGVSTQPAGLQSLGESAGNLLRVVGNLEAAPSVVAEVLDSGAVVGAFLGRDDIKARCLDASSMRAMLAYALGSWAASRIVTDATSANAIAESDLTREFRQKCPAFQQLTANPRTLSEMAAQWPGIQAVVRHPNFKIALEKAGIVQRF